MLRNILIQSATLNQQKGKIMGIEFFKFPQNGTGITKSKDVLSEAIKTADEIWWASAYLTSWPLTIKSLPKSTCSSCNIVIGSDFCITRESALLDLLRWSKKANSNVYINEVAGFHPKTILWKKNKKFYALIGSSNLSVAAWSSNVELNALIEVTKEEYFDLTNWFQDYVIGISPMLDAKWLKGYHESNRKGKPKTNAMEQIDQLIKTLGKVDLTIPRQEQKIYTRNKTQFEQLVKKCAAGTILKDKYYEKMWNLLDGSWHGRPIWSIKCKHAKWKETCRELVKIFLAPEAERDKVVKEAVDSLASLGNPTRSAWLTEILCHHYPNSYPLLNTPVKKWIKKNKIAKVSIIDGNTYLKITRIMRRILKENKNKFHNFGEMDYAIWEKIRKK